MKVIYYPPPKVCVIVDDDGYNYQLRPVEADDWDEDFWISMGSPYIVVDPTDKEVEDANGKSS